MSVLILAILAALVGAYAFRTTLFQKPEPVVAQPPASVPVPFASISLPRGRTIRLGDISLVEMTRGEMEAQGLPINLVMLAPEQIVGRVLREDLPQGKPFLTNLLYLEGSGPDIAELLKPGFRAVSLPIDEAQGGNVLPGSRVDVLFRSAPRPAQDGQLAIPETTVTLLEDIEVLAVDRPIAASAYSDVPAGTVDLRRTMGGFQRALPPMVTMAVTLDDANRLQTVEGRGELALVTRAPGEMAGAAGRAVDKYTLEGLLGIEPPPVPPESPTIVYVSEMYRRGQRNLNLFRDYRTPARDQDTLNLPTFDPLTVPKLKAMIEAQTDTEQPPAK